MVRGKADRCPGSQGSGRPIRGRGQAWPQGRRGCLWRLMLTHDQRVEGSVLKTGPAEGPPKGSEEKAAHLTAARRMKGECVTLPAVLAGMNERALSTSKGCRWGTEQQRAAWPGSQLMCLTGDVGDGCTACSQKGLPRCRLGSKQVAGQRRAAQQDRGGLVSSAQRCTLGAGGWRGGQQTAQAV